MAVPNRPVGGASIESAWGGVVHDGIVAQDIQAGSVVMTTTASGGVSPVVTVTFPRPFAAPPTVILGGALNSSGIVVSNVGRAPTATDFGACVKRTDGGGIATFTGYWLAIGPRA
jgi:hypothetical protein